MEADTALERLIAGNANRALAEVDLTAVQTELTRQGVRIH